MVADADLAIGGVVAAVGGEQFDFTVALKTGTRNHIERAIDAVAVISGISAAPDLHNVHILGIKLRADIRGNIGVGNGNPVHQPRNLMAATYMELVVNHVGTGSVVGDEVEAIRAGGSGCFGNSLATQSNRGRRGCGVKRLRGLTDFDA